MGQQQEHEFYKQSVGVDPVTVERRLMLMGRDVKISDLESPEIRGLYMYNYGVVSVRAVLDIVRRLNRERRRPRWRYERAKLSVKAFFMTARDTLTGRAL